MPSLARSMIAKGLHAVFQFLIPLYKDKFSTRTFLRSNIYWSASLNHWPPPSQLQPWAQSSLRYVSKAAIQSELLSQYTCAAQSKCSSELHTLVSDPCVADYCAALSLIFLPTSSVRYRKSTQRPTHRYLTKHEQTHPCGLFKGAELLLALLMTLSAQLTVYSTLLPSGRSSRCLHVANAARDEPCDPNGSLSHLVATVGWTYHDFLPPWLFPWVCARCRLNLEFSPEVSCS
ncbi:hypothetical protein CC79DRAFT_575771 [Sarocladium strictum]